MTSYAVGYTVGDSEPEKNADGEEYIPEHAVPILDGVAVSDPVPVIEDDEADEADGETPASCTELTAAGAPCKNAPGDDGLCGIHRRQKEASGDDDPAPAAADPAGAASPAEEGSETEE